MRYGSNIQGSSYEVLFGTNYKPSIVRRHSSFVKQLVEGWHSAINLEQVYRNNANFGKMQMNYSSQRE